MSALDIGDIVEFDIHQESRSWGFNPADDGTRATVTELGTIAYGRVRPCGREPGFYENRHWVKVRLENGTETELISSCHLNLVAASPTHRDNWEGKKLSDLPDTPIWEGDVVRLPGEDRGVHSDAHPLLEGAPDDHYIVARIEWQWGAVDGYGYHMNFSSHYDVGWHLLNGRFRTSNTELVERGWIWKWYHNEPISFPNLKEEARLHKIIGQTEEVRNPRTGVYSWSGHEELLGALRDKVAHGISVSNGFFGGGLTASAVRFKDEDLGERVRLATLEGFR